MNKLSRFVLLLILVGLGFWGMWPTISWYFLLPYETKDLIKVSEEEMDKLSPEVRKQVIEVKALRKKAMNLGLDLQGGANLLLEVDADELRAMLSEKTPGEISDAAFREEMDKANERAVEILKNRMDTFGVSEVSIAKTFDGRISVELPGVSEPQIIRESLSKVGRLEFKLVDEEAMKKLGELGVPMSGGVVMTLQNVPTNFVLPADSEWYPFYENDEYGIPRLRGWYVLKKETVLDGTYVESARSDMNPTTGQPVVSFTLTIEGAEIFADVTRQNVGRRLAIVLDGRVKSAPVINSEIPGGRGEISGRFTYQETEFLANILKAGALPVKLNVVEERIVGPSLGADAIEGGTKALIVAIIVVALFMVVWYKGSGVIAVVGLVFNMYFLLAILAGLLKATLTLSGIAGMALTVGMAVDANVLIFSRIREELKRQGRFRHAVDEGYKHASMTIWDSNLTTFFAAVALSLFGTGSIKGFGTTLAAGIIANMFAMLFVNRLVYDFLLDTLKLKKVSI
ncbi:Protein translocase subunit SecD [Brevinematales bacterium NS]|nr:Protein translocase subunit SecD [Brevinematales bacterium NS]